MRLSEKTSVESLIFLSAYVMVFATPLIFMPIGTEHFELPKITAVAVFASLMLLMVTMRMIADQGHLALGTPIGPPVLIS